MNDLTHAPSDIASQGIHAAQVVVRCSDLNESLDFFVVRLGFRVDVIFPADAPTAAVISGHGVCLRLEMRVGKAPGNIPLALRILCDAPPPRFDGSTPDGMQIEWVAAKPPLVVPRPARDFVLTRQDDANAWGVGRAGMEYRDLIPGRLGGYVVASHIRIPAGGEVPDYVHFHRVRFQMIYCKAGWVRVVYEDQGPPFVMRAGDCVLQPPEIRHRVLEASAGLEVIEIGCPAVHDTAADHVIMLPTSTQYPDRRFGGQRFSRHIAGGEQWNPLRVDGVDDSGFESCDVGISAATGGLADVSVVRSAHEARADNMLPLTHAGECLFLFVLDGASELFTDGGDGGDARGPHRLRAGDSVTIPAGLAATLRAEAGFRMLRVAL